MTTAIFLVSLCAVFYQTLAEVRQAPACPVIQRAKPCTSGLANQCRIDSDCPVFTRCCWDGCNKRCVDTSSKVHAMKSKFGACPSFEDSNKECTARFDLCRDDSSCLGDEKCCMDVDCGRKCMLPNMLQRVKNSTRAFNCPHIKPNNIKCPHQPTNYCVMDAECPTSTTCCFDGCKRRCTDKQGKMVPNKKGSLCPILPAPTACPFSFKECNDDNNCGMGLKCCSDTCNYWCMPSQTPPGAKIPDPIPDPGSSTRNLDKPGKCPVLIKPKSCEGQVFQCNYDVDCWNSDRKCCDNGCATICVDPVTAATQYLELFTTARPTVKTEKKTKKHTTHKSSTQSYSIPKRTVTKAPTTERLTVKTKEPTTLKSSTQRYRTTNRPVTKAPTTETLTEKTKEPTTLKSSTQRYRTTNRPVTKAPTTETLTEKTKESTTLKSSTQRYRTTNRPVTKAPTTVRLTEKPSSPVNRLHPSTPPLPTMRKTTTTLTKITTEKSTRKSTTPSLKITTVQPIETTIKKLNPTLSISKEVTSKETTNKKPTRSGTIHLFVNPPTSKPTLPPLTKDGIRISPLTYEAQTGENVRVTCSIKGEPFEGWYTPKGLKVSMENGMFIQGRGEDYTLVINNVDTKHGGIYTCRGAFSSALYELNIKLTIDVPNKKQFLQVGNTGIIQVSVKGYPKPDLKWMKDGYPISLSSGKYSIGPRGSLIIKNVDSSDKGNYSIMAQHFYKETNGLYSTIVGSSESAKIVVDILRGEPTSSYCPYLPPPSKCSSTHKECTSDKQCPANHKCCSDSCHVRCVLAQSSNSETVEGVQTYPSKKGFCNPKQDIRLVCRIDKQPFNGWFDTYGRKVLPTTHGNKMMVEDHGVYQVLIIKNATAEDGGKYTCQGFDTAAVQIDVNQSIAEYEHPIMLYPGEPGLLLQNIQCYPVPRFIWYKRGLPLDLSSDRYSVSPSGSLGIRRIRSTDMGVYTLKLQMDGIMKDTGVKVAAAIDGVDFTEWQDSFAPGATVQCEKNNMLIHLQRKVLNGYSAIDLSLKNTSCRATSNKTHYTLKAPLVGCGTEVKFTHEAVVYSNVVKEYRQDGLITRIQDIRVPFSCFYTKEGVTSTFGLLPTKVRRVIDGGNVTTKFELGMSLFRDETFLVSYGFSDFPLRVTVNRPLYVQVNIDSPDKRLAVMADRCYATPTQDPRHVMQYDIISDGCAVDPTVSYFKGPHTVQRFSFQAFQFVGKGKQFVYLHCNLLVCNVTDTTSRCAQGCLASFGRLKREAPQDNTNEVELTQGPFILEKRPVALGYQSGSSIKDYIWAMVGMAVFCILCLLAMVYMKKQIRQHNKEPVPDPDRETNV